MGQRNVMRWDCEERGCFNKAHRLKMEIFHDCFPGRINFTDVDGIVEINGYGLMLEWKGSGVPIKVGSGQHIMYGRLTRGKKITVLVVNGDASDMSVEGIGWYFDGKKTEPVDADFETLKKWIKDWISWTANTP